jgi:hypothetical protein
MFIQSTLRGLRTLAFGVIAGAAISVPVQADAASHFSGGGYHAGVGGFHGGAYGFHGGYGYRPGFGGYRGYGFYGGFRGGCCGLGWGWPGAFWLGALPLYYSTWWWAGVPYYYAYDNYYIWNSGAGQYQQVTPPTGLVAQGAPAPGSQGPAATELFAYPKNGQSEEQQARDKQECRDWATAQAPSSNSGNAAGAIASAAPQHGEMYLRAEAACLEGRGYSVQ